MTAKQIRELLANCYDVPKLDEMSRMLLEEIIQLASIISFDKRDKYIWGRAEGGEFFCIRIRMDDLLFVGGICVGALKVVEQGYVNQVQLLTWVKGEVLKAIDMLKAGTYRESILQNLPLHNRSGIVRLEEYWKYVPQDYKKVFESLDCGETKEFIEWVNENEIQDSGYDEMTSNMFYDACMFIYQFWGYNVEGMSPKEAYLKYADGRDCGLTKLEGDSAESFREWYGTHGFGDHAEDICSQVMFRVVQLNSGKFVFCLNRVNHTDRDMIHVLLVLIKAGFILAVPNYKQMRDYYTGKCFIGIEPYDGEFDYMREYDRKKRRLEGKFRRLPMDATQELKEIIEWLEPRICELN